MVSHWPLHYQHGLWCIWMHLARHCSKTYKIGNQNPGKKSATIWNIKLKAEGCRREVKTRSEMVDQNKDAEGCRRTVKGWLSLVMAGHQSAPVVLEWLPASFKHNLKHIDLGKIMLDPCFLQRLLLDIISNIDIILFWRPKSRPIKNRDVIYKSRNILHMSASSSTQLGPFLHSKPMTFLWSLGSNSYHNKAHMIKLDKTVKVLKP